MQATDGITPLGAADAPRFGIKAQRLAKLIAAGAPAPAGVALAADLGASALEAARLAVEAAAGASLGAGLLLALRSSPLDPAAPSPPALLNLGLTQETAAILARRVGAGAVADLRRRLIQSLSVAAFDVDPEAFEAALYDRLRQSGADDESGLDTAALMAVEADFLAVMREETGDAFPETGAAQLAAAHGAMTRAWGGRRARILRQARGADPDAGQGLILQAMALGLGPEPSGAGVAALRSAEDGAAGFSGRYLPQSQGDDAMMGLRTPHLLTEELRRAAGQSAPALEELAPDAAAAATRIAHLAETALGDACAIDFTLEAGRIALLGAAPLRANPRAAIRIAVDLAEAGVIGRDQALLRVDPAALITHLHPAVAPGAPRDLIGSGLPASPGAASGVLVFSSDAAETVAAREERAILARVETSPEDIRGMHAAAGVLTIRGGMTSHAAVIARGLGAPCVVGVGEITLDLKAKTLTGANGRVFAEGDVITIDGTAGEALAGAPDLVQPEMSGAFATLMGWADDARRMKVRANADTAQDARVARSFNVDGIGLCRTEHMFFAGGRIDMMRQMILASDEAERRGALDALLPMQRADFVDLFEIMAGLPVTIRLLDPPLHEFLPHSEAEMAALAEMMGRPLAEIARRAEELREFNPMLGNRGCRVGVTYPEIYEMQARAAFEAAIEAGARTGAPVIPEIMIPLVSANRELELLARAVEGVAEAVRAETGAALTYKIGAMVETPRAALRAEDLAHTAEFLSFGTNDLTQMTYGLSRDDAGRFMRDYLAKGVFPADPFHSLDLEGVGELMLLAAERGRRGREGLTLGLCGEHGGDPASVRFCELARFAYVSCSPFRAPIARLAAAQATLLAKKTADSP